MEDYQKKFKEFIEKKDGGGVTDKDAGSLIVDFAQFYGDYNLLLANAQINYDKLYSRNIQSTDPENGKAISAIKSEILTKDSDEGKLLIVAKSHLQNLEQMINALKSLQRAYGNEYAHSSLT